MTKLTDEMLMYYADGLLASPEKERVEQLLAEDPASHARLQVFSTTGNELASLLQAHVEAPVPQRLLDFVASQDVAPATTGRRRFKWARLKQRAEALRAPLMWPLNPAFAAGIALVAGIGLGWLIRGGGVDKAAIPGDLVRIESNGLFASEPLRHALDTLPSGSETPQAVSGGGTLRFKVKMTFRNEARDYCREYEAVAGASEHYAGVACGSGGRWIVKIQALVAPSGSRNQTAPAGGGRTAMDAVVDALIDGNPLTISEEAAAITNGWVK